MLPHGKFCIVVVGQTGLSLISQHLSEPALRSQLGGKRTHYHVKRPSTLWATASALHDKVKKQMQIDNV